MSQTEGFYSLEVVRATRLRQGLFWKDPKVFVEVSANKFSARTPARQRSQTGPSFIWNEKFKLPFAKDVSFSLCLEVRRAASVLTPFRTNPSFGLVRIEARRLVELAKSSEEITLKLVSAKGKQDRQERGSIVVRFSAPKDVQKAPEIRSIPQTRVQNENVDKSPPKPTPLRPSYHPPPSSRDDYYCSGPCFAAKSVVLILDADTDKLASVRVNQLRRGMQVQTLRGPRRVAAVVRTDLQDGETLLCRVDELEVTPYHPIFRRDGEWVFPLTVTSPHITRCDAIFSVLLEKEDTTGQHCPDNHSIFVGEVWCATLGHGITTGDDVRAHAFLGNYDKVVIELSSLDGFYDDDGVAKAVGVKRNSIDGRICGFVGEQSISERNMITTELSMKGMALA